MLKNPAAPIQIIALQTAAQVLKRKSLSVIVRVAANEDQNIGIGLS